MDDLIEALTILRKYLENTNAMCPLNCKHDELWVMDIDPADVSAEDRSRLEEIGFLASEEDAFISFRFGSA